MNERKNLIILTAVLIGILISLLALNFQGFRKDQKAQIIETDDNFNNPPLRISKGSVNYFSLKNGANKIIFYEKIDSMVYEADSDGRNKKEVARIPNAYEITYSPAGTELIIVIKEKDGDEKSYFNLETNQKVRLDKRIKNTVFSPDGKNIAYLFYDEKSGEGNISVSKPNGSDFKIIFKTRNDDFKVLWPKNDLIVFYSGKTNKISSFSIRPDGTEFQKLPESEYFVYSDEKSEEILKELKIEAADAKLSPLKDYLIFVNANDRKLYSLKL
jgi:Tol biopolymer transport system component